MSAPDPTRRALLGAAAAGWLGAGPMRAAASTGALVDVLERPAAAARLAESSPMLRLARCGRRLVAVGERGVVLGSDDDGRTWQQARVPVSVTLTGVQFTGERRGFAIGHGGVVLRSDDAGRTWRRLLDGRRLPALLASPAAARQAEQDGPDKPWLALDFADDRHGRVVGAFGMAVETADGGETWRSFADRLANPRALHLYAVQQRGDRVRVAGEQGFCAASDDGGRRFAAVGAPYRGSFFALCPLDDGSVLLGGLRGTLLRWVDDGAFHAVPPASPQGVAQLLAMTSPPGGVALVDQSGRVFAARRPGLRFAPVPVAPARQWLGVAQAADGGWVGASLDGVSRLQTSPPTT